MSTKVKDGSGAADGVPGGNDENQNDNQESVKPSSVSRDAYDKAVTEAKKAKEKLQELQAAQKQREEQELAEKQEFKKLYESAKAEADEWKGKHAQLDGGLKEGAKLNAFLSKLPGKVAKEYWSLIDLDKVAMDPETREIDEGSLAKAVKEFETKHARLIDKPNSAKLPGEAPNGDKKSVGFEAELKNASSQKELDAVMKKYGKM